MNTQRCRLLVIATALFAVSCCVRAVERSTSFDGFTATSTVSIEFDYSNYAVGTNYANNVLVTINGAAEPMTDGDVILSGTNVSLSPHSFTKPNGGQNHSISATFTDTNGTATAYATIYKHLTDVPHEHVPITAEQTVNVCKITGISSGGYNSLEGTATPQRTKACAAIATLGMGPYYPYTVQVIATVTPTPSGAMPPNFITWTGGTGYADEVAYNVYQEPKSTYHKSTIKATCGTSDYSMNVYVIGASPTGFKPANGTADGLFADCDNTNINLPSTGIFGPPLTTSNNAFASTCQIQFTVQPSELIADGNANIIDKNSIQFDVSRDRQTREWWRVAGAWTESSTLQWVSDDTQGDDEEDNNPWDGNGHIYGADLTGYYANFTDNRDWYIRRANFREWVRVGFGGQTGRQGNLVCSDDYKLWRCFREVRKVGGTWVNSNTYGNNVIVSGYVLWGTTP